jgi:hypothetical protein
MKNMIKTIINKININKKNYLNFIINFIGIWDIINKKI